ncbi:MAG: hypothetical protein HRU35_08280 [Rickettsiaceae bacterium]|nr:hypothetical protein [Rickettsiaceae bacterium]
MKVHSITTEDASEYKSSLDKQKEARLQKISIIDPTYDATDLSDNEIEKDLQRDPNLYIEFPPNRTLTNVTDSIAKGLGKTKQNLTAQELRDGLINEYDLDNSQANYITKAMHQRYIGGGYSFMEVALEKFMNQGKNPKQLQNRDIITSKIVIDKGGQVQFIGGQRLIFDFKRPDYNEENNKSTKLLEHNCENDYQSKDSFTSIISVNLGKKGDNIEKPEVAIHFVSEGTKDSVSNAIINELQEIRPRKDVSLPPKKIIQQYKDFVNGVYDQIGISEKYKKNIAQQVKEFLTTETLNKEQKNNISILKKLDMTNQVFGEIIAQEIDEGIEKKKNIEDLTESTVKHLKKFSVGNKESYLRRVAHDIVNKRMELKTQKKESFVNYLINKIYDIYYGYNSNKINDSLIKQSLIIGKDIKKKRLVTSENSSSKTRLKVNTTKKNIGSRTL